MVAERIAVLAGQGGRRDVEAVVFFSRVDVGIGVVAALVSAVAVEFSHLFGAIDDIEPFLGGLGGGHGVGGRGFGFGVWVFEDEVFVSLEVRLVLD